MSTAAAHAIARAEKHGWTHVATCYGVHLLELQRPNGLYRIEIGARGPMVPFELILSD